MNLQLVRRTSLKGNFDSRNVTRERETWALRISTLDIYIYIEREREKKKKKKKRGEIILF